MKRGTTVKAKFARLKRRLSLPTFQAIGVLEALWYFTTENAEDGDLSNFDATDIAAFLEWPGDAAELVEALVESRWLDRVGRRLLVHDWEDHLPEYLRARARKRSERNELRAVTGATDGDVSRDSHGKSRDIAGQSRDCPPPVLSCLVLSNPAQPSPTQSGQDKDTARPAPSMPDGMGDTKPKRRRALDPAYSGPFLAAWQAYPHHGARRNKPAAFTVWQARGLDERADSVMAWIDAASASEDWRKERGQFVPCMSVWLKRPDFNDPPPEDRRAPFDGLSEKGRRTAEAIRELFAEDEAINGDR